MLVQVFIPIQHRKSQYTLIRNHHNVSFVGDGSGLTGVASTDYIITGTVTFTGGVNINDLSVTGTIGGTLTYEDVKNVDSIGVITARNGIQGIGIQSGG